MHCCLTHDMLAVTIQEDAKTFYFLQNIAAKNFTKKIGRKEKMIIFKEPEETVQRRYFLKLISKIYLREHNDQMQASIIENAIDKSIKISLLKPNQVIQKVDQIHTDQFVFVKIKYLFTEILRAADIKFVVALRFEVVVLPATFLFHKTMVFIVEF